MGSGGQTTVAFVSFDYLQKNSPIYKNLDAADIDWIIPISQDLNMEKILGTDLYVKLKADVVSGSISGSYKTLLDNYVCPALVYYIIIDAIEFNAIKFTNKGLIRKSSDNSDVASQAEIDRYRNKMQSFAEYYSQRMIDYLCANDSSFPEYNDNSDEDDIQGIKNGYKSTIFIPGKYTAYKTYDNPKYRIDK